MNALNKSSKKIIFIVNKDMKLIGSLTDGDLRRGLLNGYNLKTPLWKVMNLNPKYLEHKNINKVSSKRLIMKFEALPVVDERKTIIDIKFFDKNLPKITKSKIPVVIMAGGKGERLLPYTKNLPKGLLKIKGKTLIENIIEKFFEEGFSNFIISIGYQGEKIKKYFGNGENFNVNICYIEETKPLGTVGSLSLLKLRNHKNFFLINCDVITKINFKKFFEFHKKNKALVSIALKKLLITNPFGVAKIRNKIVTGFIEKPSQEININAGMYVFNYKILKYINSNSPLNMDTLLNKLKNDNLVIYAYPFFEEWDEVGTLIKYKSIK